MSNEIFGEISDLMMSAEGSSRGEIADKVKEIIDGLNRERELYLTKVILEMEKLRINGRINAVQNAHVLDAAIAELSDSLESIEWNKRFLRSIRVNQHIRELFLPNKPNMAEEIQKDPSFLMSREQLEYGKHQDREIDLYIPGQLPGGNFLQLIEKALEKPEFSLKIRMEHREYLPIAKPRPTKNYHLLLENDLKPVSGTTIFNIRKEISDKNQGIPEDINLIYQGLNRTEFLYYCLYTHTAGTYNGIEIGILPTLIQDVEFQDSQGRTKSFLSGEISLNSLDFKLADPVNMHERHLLLAKVPESLP